MKKNLLFIVLFSLILPVSSLYADITSVTVTPASPTALSNGYSYYLAGKQYTFRVQASDPLAEDQSYWGGGVIELTVGGETVTVTISTGAGSLAGSSSTVSVTNNTTGYANLDYDIAITFAWDATEYTAGSRSVTATVNETTNGSSDADTKTFIFGICSSITVVSFSQDGVAADGRVNPWHDDFYVAGSIVYNVTNAGSSDAVNSIADLGDGEITGNTTLIFNSGTDTTKDACQIDANENGGLSYNVAPEYIYTTLGLFLSLGTHYWTVEATMATPGGTISAITGSTNAETSTNTLSIICNRIRITAISFSGGGGIDSPYYRSVNLPGTQITVTAQLESGGGTMNGNTTIYIYNATDNATFTATIASGSNSSPPTPVTTPVETDVNDGETQLTDYRIVRIDGGAFGDSNASYGQNVQARILSNLSDGGTITNALVDIQVYWDDNDPPGTNDLPNSGETPFTTFNGTMGADPNFITATTFRVNWIPLILLAPDQDFYTYRIYYRQSKDTAPYNAWKIIDTDDTSTPGSGALGTIGTGTFTVFGLIPSTNYDYFITAVDRFGQEVEHPVSEPSPPTAPFPSVVSTSDACYYNAPNSDYGFDTIQTKPAAIEASVTDGIINYSYSQFMADITASTRPLRKSSIRVSIYIVSAGDQPDSVNIILAQDTTGSGGGGDLIPLSSAPTYEIISCSKSAPNTWQCFIPSNNQFLIETRFCRFIIESIRNGTSTYSDAAEPVAGDPNDFEYTFMVQTPTNFTPWPTKILNNVITSKNPVCYPAYYLSADAYVTITVHDVKGRFVATLIDSAFRKGGQNIKEGGWNGDNKSRKKLGVGLYYMRFEAKRASDGKLILRDTKKVVMAR